MAQKLRYLLLALTLFLLVSSAHAWPRQYRCQGMVRYTPCTVKAVTPDLQRARSSIALKQHQQPTIPSDWYAKVLKQDFSRLTKRDGLWAGRIQGNGMVHLTLIISRGGIVESRTYMGGVMLANKDTAFRFRAAVPAGKEWSWRVVAFNTTGIPT